VVFGDDGVGDVSSVWDVGVIRGVGGDGVGDVNGVPDVGVVRGVGDVSSVGGDVGVVRGVGDVSGVRDVGVDRGVGDVGVCVVWVELMAASGGSVVIA
jgi:hypothetical protein